MTTTIKFENRTDQLEICRKINKLFHSCYHVYEDGRTWPRHPNGNRDWSKGRDEIRKQHSMSIDDWYDATEMAYELEQAQATV